MFRRRLAWSFSTAKGLAVSRQRIAPGAVTSLATEMLRVTRRARSDPTSEPAQRFRILHKEHRLVLQTKGRTPVKRAGTPRDLRPMLPARGCSMLGACARWWPRFGRALNVWHQC